PALARLDDSDDHRWHVLGEPEAQLLHETVGIVEQAIDEIDDLPVQALEPVREPLADDLRRETARIVNFDLAAHVSILRMARWRTQHQVRRANSVLAQYRALSTGPVPLIYGGLRQGAASPHQLRGPLGDHQSRRICVAG